MNNDNKKIGKIAKVIFFIVLFLCMFGLIFAAVGTITTFYGQTDPFDVNFTEAGNQTYYLEIPMYVYVNNVTLTITGLEIS